MLAPAGNPISLEHRIKPVPEFAGYRFVWLNSGTAALALSVLLAKTIKQTSQPEVVVPAYACPDLVAACAYAGVKCRLCDLSQNNTSYSLEHLQSVINDNTIAIIAINFLGIAEHLPELARLAKTHNIALIEDNAQWFPELNSGNQLTGDFVCLSFGRGKPVSLLGGGAVLIKQTTFDRYQLASILEDSVASQPDSGNALLLAKCLLYNGLIQPALYTLLNFIPGLTLGQTVYKPLQTIETTDKARQQLLGHNIKKYLDSEPTAQLYLQTHIEHHSGDIVSLPNKYLDRSKRLLRFPILLEDTKSRDTLLSQLEQAGLGATKLYAKTLPEIPGTDPFLLDYDDLPNATDFANRLITLPVHSLVKDRHLDKMLGILASI